MLFRWALLSFLGGKVKISAAAVSKSKAAAAAAVGRKNVGRGASTP